MFFDKVTPQQEREDQRARGWAEIRYYLHVAAGAWLIIAAVIGSFFMFAWICAKIAGN